VTDVSWRDYVDTRLVALEKSLEIALSDARRALDKAEHMNEKRFDSVNEFRAALADNGRLLMPRLEAEKALHALTERVDHLATLIDNSSARGAGQLQAWLIGATAVGWLIVIGVEVARHT